MILNRIRIQGLRCFRNPVELDGLGVGAHVVYAPNETGKSTLVLAIARALFDRYAVKTGEMEALRPWGTTLAPKIELEFEASGRRWKLQKGFLEEAHSKLSEWTGTKFEAVAEAVQADERVRAFLSATAKERGVADVGNWGLARLLWLTQDTTRHDAPGLDEPLRQRLLSIVGATSLGEREQAFLERVAEVWGEYFTPAGKPKKNSPRAVAEERAEAVEGEVAQLRQQWQAAAGLGEEVSAGEEVLQRLAAERLDHEAKLKALQAEVEREGEIQRALELKKKDVTNLGDRCGAMQANLRSMLDIQQRIAASQAQGAELGGHLGPAKAAADAAAHAAKEAGEELAGAKSVLERAEEKHERAEKIRRARAAHEASVRLGELVKKASGLEAKIAAQRSEDGRPAPAEADVAKATELQKKIDQRGLKLEALSVEIAFTAEPDARAIRWEAEGNPLRRELRAGERVAFRGVQSGTLHVEGVGRIEVRSGAEEPGRLKEEIAAIRGELARLLARFGAGSVEALQGLRNAAQARARDIQTFEATLRELLGEHRTVTAARAALERTEAELAEAAAQLGVDAASVASLEPVAGDPSEEMKAARKALQAKQERKDELERAARTAESKLQKAQHAFEQAQNTAQAMQSQLEAMTFGHGTVDELQRAARKLAGELAMAEAAVGELEARLPPPHERAATRRKHLETALESVVRQERDARERLMRAKLQLETAADDGVYTRLCQAEERQALAQAELERARRREAAVQQLQSLAQVRQEQAGRTLVAPIEEGVRRRLEAMRGAGRPGEVTLTQDLDGVSVRRADGGEAELTALSWGTQEQAMFALRLALGMMLAGQGPQPEPQLVVLDDALVNADHVRHERALDLIAGAAERLQVLILTAFPERYRRLGAREYDLQALVAKSA